MSDTGLVGNAYILDLLSGLFGSGHASWAPSTFYAYLGTGQLLPDSYYSMTATIPNDDANWAPITLTPGLVQFGYANVLPITFSAATSGDVTAWDHSGISCSLYDGTLGGASQSVMTAVDPSPGSSPFLLTPSAGMVLIIGPGNLVFTL